MAKAPKKIITKEIVIQKEVLNYLQLMENMGVCYCFRAGSGMIETKRGNMFKTGKVGCPDIVCSYKGKFIGLEIKNEKGKQSDYQKEAEQKIIKADGEYHIIRSVDEVLKIIK